ncbi:MAG: M20/M25/M40 family metallo-hydrolase [Desulfuromonadales bacterium]|nr:M20/M25/M40 family metallo-hydrolase [Desulfuromonadales bacterium]
MLGMPGKSHTGPLSLTTDEQRVLVERLKGQVAMLAGTIGERNTKQYHQLQQSAAYISEQLRGMGYAIRQEPYLADGKQVVNIEAELKGTLQPDQIVVVGTHYDSPLGSPGANDNASGVAALLELARRFKDAQPGRTLRFVAFVNEEQPFFKTELMGSRVYATGCKKRGDKIVAMLSLETIGYYSDAPKSQQYPAPFSLLYPDTGNFIAFVGNLKSRSLVRTSIKTFRETTPFPSEGLAAPEFIEGVGWSDQWAFWQEGYPGFMITDTAPFRYPHYHQASDTPDKLDYGRMARVVSGIGRVVEGLMK